MTKYGVGGSSPIDDKFSMPEKYVFSDKMFIMFENEQYKINLIFDLINKSTELDVEGDDSTNIAEKLKFLLKN